MRILHYSLGFPPYRSGGLTRFCMDLMKEQVRCGHTVSLLWPGRMGFFDKKIRIIRGKPVSGIGSFEVVNPLPVPYDEGIRDPEAFMVKGDRTVYGRFLDKTGPDVIHIHTFMGLHKGFVEEAKSRGIRLIFTAHDYFPICPKVTLFRRGRDCGSAASCSECGNCNETSLSLNKIRLLQSPIYRTLKDSGPVKALRKGHRDRFLEETPADSSYERGDRAGEYKRLRDHYHSMLKMMDVVHYNSSLTKETYESLFDLPETKVISPTHGDIRDRRIEKRFSPDTLRVRYLGAQSRAKGYYLLKKVLDRLQEENRSFRLDVHFEPTEEPKSLRSHPRYEQGELEGIFKDTDILICPSIWRETFGFTVLEALSYGVPVIISSTTGAKDILAEGAGLVFGNEESLYQILKKLTAEDLKEMNRRILESQKIPTIQELQETVARERYRKGT